MRQSSVLSWWCGSCLLLLLLGTHKSATAWSPTSTSTGACPHRRRPLLYPRSASFHDGGDDGVTVSLPFFHSSTSRGSSGSSTTSSTTRLHQQAATRAAVEASRKSWPASSSKATVVAWILAALLLREWWSKTPKWLQNVLLWPVQRLVVKPFRKLQRKVLFWRRNSGSKTTVGNNTATTAITPLTESEERIANAKGKVQFFTESSSSTSASDAEQDDQAADNNTVMGKLAAVMALAQSTTADKALQFEGLQLQGALLASLQMVQDSKRTTAQLWDQFYESSGQPLFVKRSSSSSTSASASAMVNEAAAAAVDVLLDTQAEEEEGVTTDTITVTTAAPPSTSTLQVEDTPETRTQLIETWIDLLHLADWAYLTETNDIRSKLQEQEANSDNNYQWSLIRHVKTDEPGRVGHYLALDQNSKTALVAVKGTSALSDMITDACGLPVRFNVTEINNENDDDDTDTYSTISCHEGILDASLALYEDVLPLVEQLFLPAGYRVLLVGHSLGAGVAVMLGQLLRSRIPALRREPDLLSQWLPWQRTQQPPLPLEVVAFAPPPMLDLRSATATAAYTTSIVNNDDLIPRASLSNLVYLLRFLKIVDGRLAEKGLRLEGPKGAVNLLKRVLVNSRKSDDENNDPTAESLQDDCIMTAQEIFDGINEAGSTGDGGEDYRAMVSEDLDHLFVPGKVVVVYEKHVKPPEEEPVKVMVEEEEIEDSVAEEKLTEAIEDAKSKLPQGLEDVGSIISDMLSKKEEDKDDDGQQQSSQVPVEADAIVSDGTALVLRHININQRMVGDHMPDAYEKTLRGLLTRE